MASAMKPRRWPRLVDREFLIDMGLEALCLDIFDELVAKGFAVRADEADGTPSIDWTEAGKRAVPSGFNWLVDELAARVRALGDRRRAHG